MNTRYWEYHFFSAAILDARGAEITEIRRISQKNVTVGEIGVGFCMIFSNCRYSHKYPILGAPFSFYRYSGRQGGRNSRNRENFVEKVDSCGNGG